MYNITLRYCKHILLIRWLNIRIVGTGSKPALVLIIARLWAGLEPAHTSQLQTGFLG